MREDWKTAKLGEICEIYQPKTISKKQLIEDGKYPVFGANGIIGRYDHYNHEEPQVLITCRGATCGYVNVSLPKSWITGNAMVVRPLSQNLDLRYIEYFCRGAIDFSAVISGSAQPQITRKSLFPVIIKYPPLSEQKRIVAILDEAFAGIEKAVANTEKNLANARELFESEIESLISVALAENENVHLNELSKEITDGDHMPPPKSRAGVPFITIKNINKNSREIDFSDTFKVPREYFDALKDNKKPQVGDVLFTVTGSYGIPVLVKDGHDFCFQRHIGLIRPKDHIMSEWLEYVLLSPQIAKQAHEGATGTAQKTVSLKLLRNFILPKQNEKDQAKLVSRLNLLSSDTNRLESIYQQKLKALAELKQSLLQKAFSGELTAKDNNTAKEAAA